MTGLVNSALGAINAALTAAQEAEVRVITLREDKARLQAKVEQLEADVADLKARCEEPEHRGPRPRPALVLAFDSQRREKAG